MNISPLSADVTLVPLRGKDKIAGRIAALVLVLAILGGLAGCRDEFRGKTLRVGADEAPPYVSLKTGKPTGVAVDLLTEAARRQSIRLQWVEVRGVSPDQALDRDLVDIWPVLGVTEQRSRKYHMTQAWFLNNFALFSRSERPVNSVAESAGLRISYAAFPLATAMARKTLPASARLVAETSYRKVLEAVCLNDADAGFLEARTVERSLPNLPVVCRGTTFDIRGLSGTEAYGAIGARLAAGPAAEALHGEILRMVDDGTFLKALDKWSAATASEMRSLFNLQRLQARDRLFSYGLLATLLASIILLALAVSFYRARVRTERSRQAALRRSEMLGRLARGADRDSILRDLHRMIESALPGRSCSLILSEEVQTNASVPQVAIPITGSDNRALGVIGVGDGSALRRVALETLTGLADLVALVIEHKKILDKLSYNARHDQLTGFVNRWVFAEELERTLAECDAMHDAMSVIFMDLDRFKYVNDRFGHWIGDLYLREAAHRVSCCLRAGDIAGRIGGDEFTILLHDAAPEEGEQIARRILDSFAKPFQLEGVEIYGTISIGISSYPADARTANELQINADSALYAAKEQGRNRLQTFSKDVRSILQDGSEMEQLVRQALEHNYLEVFYQPQHLASGELAGVEALVRIRHPKRGIVTPDLFIEVAERTGLVGRLDSWVLNEACRQLAEWREEGLDIARVSVNVSGLSISSGLVDGVKAALTRWNLQPSALEMELTETAAIAGGPTSVAILMKLRELGISLALDDFGTGYSSLNCLQLLPIDTLKIDKSFIRNLQSRPPSSPLVQAIMATARVLGMTVVAEGVENTHQLEWLTENGCDVMQGFYFSEPLDHFAVAEYVRLGQCTTPYRSLYASNAFAA